MRSNNGSLSPAISQSSVHQRAGSDVAVSLLPNRLKQRRNRLRAGRTTHGAGRARPGRVIEIAELGNGGVELRRRHRLGPSWFLRDACGGLDTKGTKDTEDQIREFLPLCP